MTRAVPQSASKFAPMTTTSTLSAIAPPPPKKNLATSSPTANNGPKHQSTGSLPNETPPLQQSLPSNLAPATSNENLTSVSPTPSQLSTGSNKRKLHLFQLFT